MMLATTASRSTGKRRAPLPALAILAFIGSVGAVRAQDLPSSDVTIDHTATRRICQVTGEVDDATGQPTVNTTETRFKFRGTDLGASFEHEGRLVFLFGDTHPAAGLHRQPDRDLIAFSDDNDPEDCIRLDVPTDRDGGFRPLQVPQVDGGAFSVPTAGFSTGGRIYVVATTDRRPSNPMNRSVLASSEDGGHSFRREFDLSTGRFINIAAAVANVAEIGGLPVEGDRAILLWGSGTYRKSNAYLAVLPEGRADRRDALRYFAGLDPASAEPVWSSREEDSAALFHQPCLGELSVAWNEDLRKWLMLYNCGKAGSQILIRTADRPWGPWSPSQVLFDPSRDGGFCVFMNARKRSRTALRNPGCPPIADKGRIFTAGDPYAPYLVARFARGVPGSESDIYFLMSTWNPYNVVLMKARLRLREPQPIRQADAGDKASS